MRSFENNKLQNLAFDHNLLKTIRILGEYRGKEDLYRQQSPQTLKTLRQSAVIQSTESSNRIEGIDIPDVKRLRSLVEKHSKPENRSEQEIAGYREVLNTIHGASADMAITPNIALQLHRDLFQFTPDRGGVLKQMDNSITETGADGNPLLRFTPVPAWQTKDALERLYFEYGEADVDPLISIPMFVLDFLCIHPFKDGNGRMARLLSLHLLYKAGYRVGRYISLERIVEETKESYYETLHTSSQGWHEGEHDIKPWLEYFLGVLLLGAYREFENRVGLVDTAKGAKAAMVVGCIEKLPTRFSIGDVIAQCPMVGIDHIRKTIRAQRDAGKLRSEGRGPKAMWLKISE